MVLDNAEESLITRDESSALKAFLIILVVLGHDKYLHADGWSFKFLYSFHVYAFFYLPFLYDYREQNIVLYAKKLTRQLLMPFFICYATVLMVSYTRNAGETAFFAIIHSLWSGNVRASLGMGGFLWFIPAFFSLMLWRQIFYRSSMWIRCALLLASLFALLCWSFGWLLEIRSWLPLLSFTSLAMLLPAITIRQLLRRALRSELIALLFFILVLVKMIVYPGNYPIAYTIMNRMVAPVIIFLFVYSLRHLFSLSSWVKNMGRYTFPIYLIHVFVYNVAYLAIDRKAQCGIGGGVLLFVVVLFASMILAQTKISRFLFQIKS